MHSKSHSGFSKQTLTTRVFSTVMLFFKINSLVKKINEITKVDGKSALFSTHIFIIWKENYAFNIQVFLQQIRHLHDEGKVDVKILFTNFFQISFKMRLA